jgi:tight adherence protein B
MTPAIITVFAFTGTALLVGTVLSIGYDRFIRYPTSIRGRLREVTGKSPREKTTSLLNVKHIADSASKSPNHWRARASDLIEQSGLPVETRTMLLISLGLAAAVALVSFVVIGRWWSNAIGLIIGFAIPWLYILTMRRVRTQRLTRQLPDALDVISRAVRAGQTVPASFQMVADDFAPPISDEFRQCYEEQNLGIPYDAALRNLAHRTGIMELRILVVALLVQSRSGGSLTELVQNLASMVRKRLVLQQKVKALTGEGRMQATVLIALPFLVFIAMYVLNREYAQVLLDRPWLLAGCVAAQAAGAAMIHKLIQIDF